MKSKVKYSRYAGILTAAIFIILFVACLVSIHEKPLFFIWLAAYLVLIVSALFYAPSYIKATTDSIIMGSLLRKKKIPMSGVESVELFQPTMGAIRIIGSGGFMDYWGLFKEGDIGRYSAFYGRSSDCFLVRMKNGDKYVLGCEDPAGMVAYINSGL